MEFQNWMFDKRVLRRNIRKGLVNRNDYGRYLENLPDTSSNVVSVEEEEATRAAKARETEGRQSSDADAEPPNKEGEDAS